MGSWLLTAQPSTTRVTAPPCCYVSPLCHPHHLPFRMLDSGVGQSREVSGLGGDLEQVP